MYRTISSAMQFNKWFFSSQSGFTPLHIAAHYGNIAVAGLLIEKGADVNFKARVINWTLIITSFLCLPDFIIIWKYRIFDKDPFLTQWEYLCPKLVNNISFFIILNLQVVLIFF